MRIIYIGFLSLLMVGCYNPSKMVDKRTALEQELTRAAILQAVNELPILKNVLHGRWKIEVVSSGTLDDSWTYALLRQRLVLLGADISTNASENLPVVEAILQFAGSDIDNFILGIPIPGSMGTTSFGLYHDNNQRGRARIRLNFWTNEGILLAQTPAVLGETHYSDITVLTFFGPFSFTSLKDVKSYGRFTKLGKDEWQRIRHTFKSNEAQSSDVWIKP